MSVEDNKARRLFGKIVKDMKLQKGESQLQSLHLPTLPGLDSKITNKIRAAEKRNQAREKELNTRVLHDAVTTHMDDTVGLETRYYELFEEMNYLRRNSSNQQRQKKIKNVTSEMVKVLSDLRVHEIVGEKLHKLQLKFHQPGNFHRTLNFEKFSYNSLQNVHARTPRSRISDTPAAAAAAAAAPTAPESPTSLQLRQRVRDLEIQLRLRNRDMTQQAEVIRELKQRHDELSEAHRALQAHLAKVLRATSPRRKTSPQRRSTSSPPGVRRQSTGPSGRSK